MPNVSVVAEEGSGCGGGVFFELYEPQGLLPSERAMARKALAVFPAELAQQLLDELAGRMAAGAIQVSPLAYLHGLIKRAHADAFMPEVALRVADTRERRRQSAAALRRAEAIGNESLPADAVCADNPLLRRLTTIRDNARHRNRSDE